MLMAIPSGVPVILYRFGVDNQADPLGLAITPFLSYTKRQITQQASNHSGCVLEK